MEDTDKKIFDYGLNARELRKYAKRICEKVESNDQMQVLIYQGPCGKPHIRFIFDDGHAEAETNESTH